MTSRVFATFLVALNIFIAVYCQSNNQRRNQHRYDLEVFAPKPCSSNPCKNGGICVDKITSQIYGYSCNCMGQWMGANCDQDKAYFSGVQLANKQVFVDPRAQQPVDLLVQLTGQLPVQQQPQLQLQQQQQDQQQRQQFDPALVFSNSAEPNRFKKAHSGNNWPNNDNAQWPNDNNDWYNDNIWKNNNNMWQPNLANQVNQKNNPWAVTQPNANANPNPWQQNNGWNIGSANGGAAGSNYGQAVGCASYPCLNNGRCISNGLNSFTCSCTSDFYGLRCESKDTNAIYFIGVIIGVCVPVLVLATIVFTAVYLYWNRTKGPAITRNRRY